MSPCCEGQRSALCGQTRSLAASSTSSRSWRRDTRADELRTSSPQMPASMLVCVLFDPVSFPIACSRLVLISSFLLMSFGSFGHGGFPDGGSTPTAQWLSLASCSRCYHPLSLDDRGALLLEAFVALANDEDPGRTQRRICQHNCISLGLPVSLSSSVLSVVLCVCPENDLLSCSHGLI